MNTGIKEVVGRIRSDEEMQNSDCVHLNDIQPVNPSSGSICQECVNMGDAWVNLRICLVCGNVACCDSSINKHARQHFHDSNHSIILSFEPRELWMYCFADDTIFVAPE